jgi:hypothetical protein
MNARTTSDSLEAARAQAAPALDVQIVYQDRDTGLRAKLAVERAVQQFAADAEFQVGLWRFDLLQEPGWRRMATQAATRADIVLISAHGWERLPEAVSQWIEEWITLKSDAPSALVVSLDGCAKGSRSASQILAELGRITRLAGAELISHFGPDPAPPEALTIEAIHLRAEFTTSILGEALRRTQGRTYRHWGMNK